MGGNKMNEIEQLKKELEMIKKEQSENQEKESLKVQIVRLKAEIKQQQFRKDHAKLYTFSQRMSNGIKGMFSGIGRTIRKAASGLEKSDRYISEAQKQESLNRVKPKRDEVNDALNSLD